MLIYVCVFALLLFAFMWMVESLNRRQTRDREECRRRLRSRLSSVKWEEPTDSADEPLTLGDWEDG